MNWNVREAHPIRKAGEGLTICWRLQRIQHEHEGGPCDSDVEREAAATHARWKLAVSPERGTAKNDDGR